MTHKTMPEELLDIVNEADEVVGQAPRSRVHREGLRHREVGIWFVTPKGELIFQHRSPTKETSPNLLATTAAGHVPSGEGYDQTALREVREETGLALQLADLQRLEKLQTRHTDPVTGAVNHAFKQLYAYRYTGELANLHVEPGEAVGYEPWPIDAILNLREDERAKFIADVRSPELQRLFRRLKANL